MKKKQKNSQKKVSQSSIVTSIAQDDITRQSNNIVNALAINHCLKEHISVNNFRLIFESYNHGECELCKIDAQLSKKLIELFNRITGLDGKTIKQQGLLTPPINPNDSKYKNLLSTMPIDTELYHLDFGSRARLFYYCVGNFFCIVTIRLSHY